VSFDNLKIANKVMAPVMVLMGVIVVSLALSFAQTKMLLSRMEQVTEVSAPADLALSRFNRHLNSIGYAAYRTLVYDGASPQAKAASDDMEANYADAKAQLDEALKADPSLKPVIADFRKRLDGAYSTVGQGRDLGMENADEAAAMVFSVADPDLASLSKDVVARVNKHTKQTNALAHKAEADANRSLVTNLIIALLAGGAALAFSIWVGRRKIAGPVNDLQRTMEVLARGDLSASVHGADRKDELGGMARAVQVFKDNAQALKTAETEQARLTETTEAERMRNDQAREAAAREQAQVMQAIADGLSRLADGDLTYRIDQPFPESFVRLRDDFNGAVGQLEGVVASIVGATRNIGSGADEIASAADDMSRRTEQQAASLEETAAALDEITATVHRSSEGATRASQVVGSARGDAERSGLIMRDATAAMGEIEGSSKQITQIIGVIDEIAFQTNLLALNAGVEAARAGEAGRGFAVVASEVRALAQRSAEAAKEIKGLISASTQQINQGVSLVGQTGEALHQIVSKVSEIDALVSEIAASSQEQAIGLGQVNTAVNQMDQIVQQNAAMVEESTAASHALRSEATGLVEMVSRFRVNGEQQQAPARRSAAPQPAAPRPAAPNARPAANPVAAIRAKVAAFAGGGRSNPPPPSGGNEGGWEEF